MSRNCAPRAKFLLKLFLKSLRFPKAAPWSLSAESEITTGFSFCKAFSFGPFVSKEKALLAENLLKTDRRGRRSLQVLTVFLKLLPVEEHSICSRREKGGYGIRPYGFDCFPKINACRGGYYPPVVCKNIIAFCADDRWSPLRI